MLEDCDLIRLLNLMERARECIVDGVSFEDAGLVRSVAGRGMHSVRDSNAERAADQAAIGAGARRRAVMAQTDSAEQPPF